MPSLQVLDQAAYNRVTVHVAQFLYALLFVVYKKVIKGEEVEIPRMFEADQASCHRRLA